jgi:hypothetical protein
MKNTKREVESLQRQCIRFLACNLSCTLAFLVQLIVQALIFRFD